MFLVRESLISQGYRSEVEGGGDCGVKWRFAKAHPDPPSLCFLIRVVDASQEVNVVHWEAGDEFWPLARPTCSEALAGGGEWS